MTQDNRREADVGGGSQAKKQYQHGSTKQQ